MTMPILNPYKRQRALITKIVCVFFVTKKSPGSELHSADDANYLTNQTIFELPEAKSPISALCLTMQLSLWKLLQKDDSYVKD